MSNLFHSVLASRQPFATRLLSQAVSGGRLAHAYLLTGRANADKLELAKDLACYLNCEKVKAHSSPCYLNTLVRQDSSGFCQNCRWISEEKHPQAWIVLGTEGTKSGKISVERARLVGAELSKASHFTRVIIVSDAAQEIFHRPAANALLKTIEDPAVRCIFLLFASSDEDVLPTIVSRCQSIPMRVNESLGCSLTMKEVEPATTYDAIGALFTELDRNLASKDSGSLATMLEFARKLHEQIDEGIAATDVFDTVVSLELKRLAKRAASHSPEAADYLRKLLSMSESSKEQIKQYVSAKAVCENFAVSWWQLGRPLC